MTSSPSTWMPIYWGDYLKCTMHLSAEEHGAYLLLICHYWQNGGKIKNDEKIIKNVCKISSKKLQNVLAFFEEKDGFLMHSRIDNELTKAVEHKEKQGNRTKAATEARLSKSQRNVDVTSNVTLSPSPSYVKDKSLTNNKKENFLLPTWIPKEAWQGFDEIRRKTNNKYPWTERAKVLAVAELKKLVDAGYDAEERINKAVTSGWKTFYPDNNTTKGNQNGTHKQTTGENYGKSKLQRAAESAAWGVIGQEQEPSQASAGLFPMLEHVR